MQWEEQQIQKYLSPVSKPSSIDPSSGALIFTSDDADVFEERWQRHSKPQATDQFWKILTDPSALQGKIVLDAGCGIGRYTQRAIEAKARQVISVDISSHAIHSTSKLAPGALLLQADLLDLPVRTCSVDFAFSIGVLHHTPDPRRAFAQVARTVKQGGMLAVWVYCVPDDPIITAAINMLHDITRACPKEALYNAIKTHATSVRDSYSKAWGPLQQVLRVSISSNDEECVSDTFDWHGPRYRSLHTEKEVAGWFDQNGFDVVKIGEHKVNVLGKKR